MSTKLNAAPLRTTHASHAIFKDDPAKPQAHPHAEHIPSDSEVLHKLKELQADASAADSNQQQLYQQLLENNSDWALSVSVCESGVMVPGALSFTKSNDCVAFQEALDPARA